jgi:hypothetical protein
MAVNDMKTDEVLWGKARYIILDVSGTVVEGALTREAELLYGKSWMNIRSRVMGMDGRRLR